MCIRDRGCEPLIGQTPGTREFFKGLSDITGGRYLSLHDAKLLPAIIVGGAEEEAALQRLNAAVEEEIQNVRSAAPGLRDEEVFQVAAENCAKKNICAPQIEMDMQHHIPMSRCDFFFIRFKRVILTFPAAALNSHQT